MKVDGTLVASSVGRLEAAEPSNSDVCTVTGRYSVDDEADILSEPVQEPLTFIFDWDDTLLATSHMNAVLKDCSSKGKVAKLPAKACRRHADLVRKVLVEARSLGNVVIVTTSKRPWVTMSAASSLPGVDFPALFQKLNISVHYATEHQDAKICAEASGSAEDKFKYYKSCKRNCFSKVLQLLYPDPLVCRNVISIGDSLVERDAIKEALQHVPRVCRTVKLMNSPSLKQLGHELDVLSTRLQCVAMHEADLDMSFEDLERFPY